MVRRAGARLIPFAFWLAAGGMLGAEEPEVAEPSCYPARQQVVIDGDLSEWDLRGPIRIDTPEQRDVRANSALSQQWAGPTDASAVIYLAYDADYLYIAGVIGDEDRVAQDEVWFNGDCIEIFLDTDRAGDRDELVFNDDDYQLCVMAYNPARPWGVLKHGSLNPLSDGGFHGVKVASRPAEGAGYTFESCWPFANFKAFSLARDRRLGINIAVNDHDRIGESSTRQNYLTINGRGQNYQTTEHFLDLRLVGDPPPAVAADDSASQLVHWIVAVAIALLLMLIVARTATAVVRFVDTRLLRWRRAGIGLMVGLAVVVFVVPTLLAAILQWRVAEDDRSQIVGRVLADLADEGLLSDRGLGTADALVKLLRGQEVPATPSYDYACVELRRPESDPNLRRSVEMVPVRQYGFALEAGRQYVFPLAEPVPLSRLYVFGSARLDDAARRRPDVSGISDPAIEVGVRPVGARDRTALYPAFDHELIGDAALPSSDRFGIGWRERDRVVDQYFLGKAELDERPIEAVLVTLHDSALTFRLQGVTVASRGDDQLRPLSLTRASAAGPPAALWDGYPRDVGITVAGGGTRDRFTLPIGRVCDVLWLFYSTLDPEVVSSELAGIEVGRFVVQTADGGQLAVPLRAGVQVTYALSAPESRAAEMESRYAFRWTPERGRTHNIEVLEVALPEAAEVAGIEMVNLGQLSGLTLHAVTSGTLAQRAPQRPGSSLVLTDRDHIRVRADFAEQIAELGLALFVDGRLAQADFPEPGLADSLKGAGYPLGGGAVEESAHSYVASLGEGRYFVRSFPVAVADGAPRLIEVAQPIRGLARLLRLQQQAAVVALLLVVPLLLFYLLDGTTRIARLHLRLTTLLVTTSLVPIVLMFTILFNVVVKDRERLRESRAATAMQQVASHLERMYVQTQRTAREVMDSEVVREVRATGKVPRDRMESYLKEAMGLQPVPGLDLGVRVEVEVAGGARQRYFDHPGGEAASRFDKLPAGVHYHWDRLVFVGAQAREEEGLKVQVTVAGEVQPALIQELSAATGIEVSLLSLRGFPIAGSRRGDPAVRSRDVDTIRRQNRPVVREGPGHVLLASALFGSPGDDPAALVEIAFPPDPFQLRVLFAQLSPQTFFFWFCVLGLLAAVFMGSVATWRITGPIEVLEAAARQVARGDLNVVVETGARGEVGRLARSFNTMISELRTRAAERQRLEHVMATLSSSMDPEATATAAVRLLAEGPPATGAALYRRDPERDGLVRVGESVGDDRDPFPTQLPATAMFARVMSGREPWILPPDDPDMVNTRIWTRAEERLLGTHLSVLLPLPLSDHAVGLVILKYGGEVFRAELTAAAPILQHIAGQASVALENAFLYQLAVRDPQTGLYVESYFRRRLAEEVDRAQHRGGELSLAHFAVDDLPRLTRHHGPDAARDELVRLSLVLRRESRDMYLVSRSHDSFFVLLPDSGRSAAEAFAERVLRDARSRSAAEGRAAAVFAGIATFPHDGGSAAYLLDGAARDLAGNRRQRVELALAADVADAALELDVEPYVFASPAMRALLAQVARVAQSRASVLVLGETGSGKEVIAELLHRFSDRAPRPFLAINCSAVPEALLEAELFGYEKGAFTGASQSRAGQLEAVSGGTLFLDEVGDMALPLQAKLLRVLQDGRVVRLGSNRPIDVDVRIVAATHRDLPAMIEQGTFRADLYFRLKVVSLLVPPLRERREDIPGLVATFVAEFCREHGRKVDFAPAALDRLYSYAWTGNVRELKNVVSRALLLAEGDIVLPSELQFEAAPSGAGSRGGLGVELVASSPSPSPTAGELNERQRKLLHSLADGNVFRSRDYFELVGVSPRTGLRDLNDLLDRGIIERLGRRRAAIYRIPERRTNT